MHFARAGQAGQEVKCQTKVTKIIVKEEPLLVETNLKIKNEIIQADLLLEPIEKFYFHMLDPHLDFLPIPVDPIDSQFPTPNAQPTDSLAAVRS